MTRCLFMLITAALAAPVSAWEVIVGGGLTQPRFSTDLINDTVQIKDYELKLDSAFKAYGRFNFTPYFGLQIEAADYGSIESSEILSSTILNVTREATVNVTSEIKATNYALFIGSNRDDFFAMFGKFGYSSFSNDLVAQVLDNTTTPGTEVYIRDEKVSESAPLLGFGVSFRLPWNLFILAEYEIINGDDQDIESANALIEYRF